MNSSSITQADQGTVQQIINQLNNSKAEDIFGTLDTKQNSDTLIRPITCMINLSISAGEFPQIFKQGIITPIFEPDKAGSFRLISILPTISKLIENLAAEQLINSLERNQLLHPKQFRF